MKNKKLVVVCLLLVFVLFGTSIVSALTIEERARFFVSLRTFSIEDIETMSVEDIAANFCWDKAYNRYIDEFFKISISKDFTPFERKAFIARITVMKWVMGY
ncbi:MAG: hypothetical protein UMV23_05470 [Halanaerobium sp.]|nr:hypothetical protein [Halanaerobium sp.]